jgi:membrane-associated phospholipid phosphatase
LRKVPATIYVLLICIILIVISYVFLDIPTAEYCRGLRREVIDLAEIITPFGVTKWYLIGSFLFFLIFRYMYKNNLWSSEFLFIFSSLSCSGLMLILIKWLAGRYRPINFFEHGYYGFHYFGVGYELTSFPSGHAQTAFALATALTMLFPRWGIPAFIAAAAVSISRIVLTSHYLSDVIAGAAVGILGTLAVKYVFDRINIGLTRKQVV